MENTNRYTLFELNEYVRRVIALNFSELVWISAELAQVSESRGHLFLSLVQKEFEELSVDGKIIAQSEAVIWAMDHRRLKRKMPRHLTQVLRPGMEILFQAKVEFHERYGLKLIVQDLDPAYTVGKMELKRQENLEFLRSKGLLEKNKALELPKVLQNIAVISSERAAGFQDFKNQLLNNAYGYHINFVLMKASMQGELVKKEVIAQLDQVNAMKELFDAVVMIRGGGARLDLIAFDDVAVCTSIANCQVPVITGIGHEIDETIADLVAFESLKTPTAVAEWIIQQNLFFEMGILELGQGVKQLAHHMLGSQNQGLENIKQSIQLLSGTILKQEERMLAYMEETIPQQVSALLKGEKKKLDYLEHLSTLLDPEKTLKRGYSLTLSNGKIIRNAEDLKEGRETIETHLQKGKLRAL